MTTNSESMVPGIMSILEQRLSYVRRKSSTDKKPESTPVVIRVENGSDTIKGAVENAALVREKQRHQETKRLANMANDRIKHLQRELDEKNSDIEGFRERARELTQQIDTANMAIEELERDVEMLPRVRAKVAAQEERIKELERQLEADREGRRKAEMEATQSKEALSNANINIDKLNQSLLAALDHVDQKEEEAQEEERLLRAQLAAANEAIATKNEALRVAEEEKATLRTSLLDTRHSLEEATAVIEKASLSFNQEVSRFMNMLQTTSSAISVPSVENVA